MLKAILKLSLKYSFMNNELEQYQNVRWTDTHTDTHTFLPANSLVWGSLRLAPIIQPLKATNNYLRWQCRFTKILVLSGANIEKNIPVILSLTITSFSYLLYLAFFGVQNTFLLLSLELIIRYLYI